MWWRLGVIVLAGLLAYSNSLSGPFIIDDVRSIVENREIRAWWDLKGLVYSEPEIAVSGRPLVNASLAINYALRGVDVRGYHVWNVAVHLGCALLLFGVVRRTLPWRGLGARFSVKSLDLSFAVALLWVLHPLNTEAVDYVTERTESMMGLFYLFTIYASLRAVGSSSWMGWTAVATATCALGMACKESMVTAPAMVMLFDRVFIYDSIKKAAAARWRLYIGLASTWLVLAWLLSSGPRMSSAGFSVAVSPWGYLLNQTVMAVRYLRLAVWPSALVLDYGWPVPLTLVDVLPQTLVVLALLAVTTVALIRRPPLGFLGAWFFITLAPTSSIVPIATEVGAERRMYVPLIAVVALAVVGAVRVWDSVWASRVPREADLTMHKVWVLRFALMFASIALALGTLGRNREYRSSLLLAEKTLERYPTPFAHHGLAIELIAAGRREEAMRHLRQAVPGAPRAHFTLGVELFGLGQWDEAIRELEVFIREEPTNLDAVAARELLGRAYAKQGRMPEALEQYRAAVQTNPSPIQRAEIHRLLADALFAQRSFDEAVTHYRAYLQVRPAEVAALTNIAIALGATDRLDEGLVAFRRAVEVEPQNGSAQRNLANALFDHRDLDEAAVHARQAVMLRPDDPAAYDVLGRVLAVQGRVADAISQFERALRIDPNAAEVRDHLARVVRLRVRSTQAAP